MERDETVMFKVPMPPYHENGLRMRDKIIRDRDQDWDRDTPETSRGGIRCETLLDKSEDEAIEDLNERRRRLGMQPDKALDTEGTPLPPSIPREFFNKPDFDGIGLGHWDHHKKMIMGSKILGTKIRRWRQKNILANKTLYHTKKNGVGLVQSWCDCILYPMQDCQRPTGDRQ